MPTASGSLAFLGAARFQGFWNADTNNASGSALPGGIHGAVDGLFLTGASTSNGGYALATGLSASAGDYWQITGSGTHNVDGTTSWALNDFCIYSGSAGGTGDWIKLAFEDTMASIVLGDLSSTSFHIGSATNDKHIIFATGSTHSGSDNFIFDYSNNRVGIGTTSPETLAHIQNGSAGTIATTAGALLTLESNEKPKIHFQSPGAYGGAIVFGSPTDNDEGVIDYDHGSDRFLFKTGGNTKMTILDNNVGIATTAPLDTLSVTGTLGVSGDTSLGNTTRLGPGNSVEVVLDFTSSADHGRLRWHGDENTFFMHNDFQLLDDIRLGFGEGPDAALEYDENGQDALIISGSRTGGVSISGSKLTLDEDTVVSGTIAGPGSYLAVKSTGQVVLTSSTGQVSAVANGANNRIATFTSADALNGEAKLTFDGTRLVLTGSLDIGAGSDDPTINFGLGDSTTPAMIKFDDAGDSSEYLIVSGSKLGGTQLQGSRVSIKPLQQDYGVIFETGDIVVADDVKLAFGATRDGHIEYNENGDDFLVISGSSNGAAISGSVVKVDGVLKADAGTPDVHQLTGSLQMTGLNGVAVELRSTGSVSLRLEADTDNSGEDQNPFIELVQDGGATDYTIGLTKGTENPEGASVAHMADNALAIGSNITIDSTNVGHIQFYNRATASFSLMDRGSTNHGTPADREGFRVGVGPIFDETNFPKARVEIHNTADSPCTALALTVSGTAQSALTVEAANTTKSIVEITGSSLTTGEAMHLYSNSSSTSDRSLLKITNDNASSEKVVLVQLTQDAFSYPAFIQRGGGTVKNLPTFNTSHTGSQVIDITHLIEGTYFAVGRNAGKTDTTPTSAQIVARIKDAAVGDAFDFSYFNVSSNTVTLAGGTNVKMLNTAAASFDIAAGTGRTFAFVLMNVGSGTEQVNMIPKTSAVDLNS